MPHPRELKIEDFTYELPDERIAKYPLAERADSKLLLYKEGAITERIYKDIAEEIPEGTLLVFNETKVVHARLLFKKPTGSTIEVFCLEPHESYGDVPTAMLSKGKVWWQCMIGGANKWKDGMVLQMVFEEFTLSASIVNRASTFTLSLEWDNDMTFAEVLHIAGKVPLPPYLHRNAEQSDEERYQTIYAKEEGSVAAPTAGLHFTDSIMRSLANKNIDTAFVTLHVGAGTFKPVKSETMETHDMHAEWIVLHKATVEKLIAKLSDGIVSVGTTSMRTLESLYWIGAKLLAKQTINFSDIAVHQWDPYELATTATTEEALQAIIDMMERENKTKILTRTQILIAPGYRPRVIKGLITNFHQPKSTLLLLVGAMIGNEWKKVYDYALANDFRFLSYGDGSLLWLPNS
ncbi:MAG: S-adenosylmethionine:tRNA ribosyltransferase-isomerase [Flavipsychrobacter sp.]